MSPPVAGNRHFSVSVLGATLNHRNLRLRNVKETIPPVKNSRNSRRYSDLCLMSIRFRVKRKKTKGRKNSKITKGTSANEIKRKRGRPRRIRNPSEETEVLDLTGEASVDINLGMESRYVGTGSILCNPAKRKRGRPPKNRDGFNQPAVNLENREGTTMVDVSALDKEELVNLENREGTMVDLSALANVLEDPYEEELRRITVGLKTKEEILGFLEQLNGEWVNIGKKKKVVRACDFGGYLPKGWKLMLYIKRKGSNLLLACRRYISPDGQQFETCKEVSTYLQSLLVSGSRNWLNSLQSDNKTLGQQPVMANKSLLCNSDTIGLPVPNSITNQSLEIGRTVGGDVFEEAKGVENGDVADPVKTSLVDKDNNNADFLNGDDNDDDNMENLAALSNPKDQETMSKAKEHHQYFSSQIH
ncbi:PREDICTED: methyl-CpG-binding domain-containing protein 8-like isoform X2 [Camelina sativa]|uniref:Methyl-CpG-binding domain-containing protein 8-like isoform X2 n=1 Tax=Camelina sativa TaxID=90675 RepID=A0ABM0YBX3_CAMSA|nr:PREDICTED: methyl-CpG-binding domain-containing protein 8-like isoform X2 [Camelina sativa]